VTADNLLAQGTAHRPLSACIDAIRDTVQEVPEAAEPEAGYQAMARLSGHLAAMWRTVYPRAGQLDAGGELRAVCLSRAREAEWLLRRLECQLSGDVSAVGLPARAVCTALRQQLNSYWPAEQALVAWVEDRLAIQGRDQAARAYQRALAHAPTRPHPRCPRSGPLRHLAFWLHSRWDRLLDTMDSRAGVGHDFPAGRTPPSREQPESAGAAGPWHERGDRIRPGA
jgi:hypothetical protein